MYLLTKNEGLNQSQRIKKNSEIKDLTGYLKYFWEKCEEKI